MGRRYPVDGCVDLPPIGGKPASGLRIVGAVHLAHFSPVRILYDADAPDKVPVAEADFPAHGQPEKLFRRILQEIFLLDIENTGEGHLPGSHFGILRMIRAIELLHFSFRVVIDHDAQRSENGQDALRPFIQVLPYTVLQKGHVDETVILGNADPLAEVADRFGAVPPSPHA